MTNDNNKNNELVSEQDADPTVELEPLSKEICYENAAGQLVEAESDANTFDFTESESDVENPNDTIAILQFDLQTRTESISKLQFDIQQLRCQRLDFLFALLEQLLCVRMVVACEFQVRRQRLCNFFPNY